MSGMLRYVSWELDKCRNPPPCPGEKGDGEKEVTHFRKLFVTTVCDLQQAIEKCSPLFEDRITYRLLFCKNLQTALREWAALECRQKRGGETGDKAWVSNCPEVDGVCGCQWGLESFKQSLYTAIEDQLGIERCGWRGACAAVRAGWWGNMCQTLRDTA